MAERLDPWQNITGVHWRDSTEGTEEPYPEPDVYCEVVAGEAVNGNTTYRGYHRGSAILFPDTGRLGYLVKDDTEGKSNVVLAPNVILLFMIESVSTRGNLAGIGPASSWSIGLGRKANEDAAFGHDVRGLIDGKMFIVDGQPIIPQIFISNYPATPPVPAVPYPAFSTSEIPGMETVDHGWYYPAFPDGYGLGTASTSTHASGDRDPPGGKYVLGFQHGATYKVWLADPKEDTEE